jgi:hypothetical protein
VGVLHPLADVAIIALLQGAGAVVTGRSHA